MKVHIIGPNLPDQSKGSFHVHAEGCADVERSVNYRSPDFATDKRITWEARSQLDVAAQTYADQIAEGSMTAEDGVFDMHFFPCCQDLPYSTEVPS